MKGTTLPSLNNSCALEVPLGEVFNISSVGTSNRTVVCSGLLVGVKYVNESE